MTLTRRGEFQSKIQSIQLTLNKIVLSFPRSPLTTAINCQFFLFFITGNPMSKENQVTQKFGFSIHEDNVVLIEDFKKEEIGKVGKFRYFLFEAEDKTTAQDLIHELKQTDLSFIMPDGSKTTEKLNVVFSGDELQTRAKIKEQQTSRQKRSREFNQGEAVIMGMKVGATLAQLPPEQHDVFMDSTTSAFFSPRTTTAPKQKRIVIIPTVVLDDPTPTTAAKTPAPPNTTSAKTAQ